MSYCRDHKPVQAPLLETNRRREEMWQKRDECGCCTMELEEEGGTTDFLWTPCCNGWFHRQVDFCRGDSVVIVIFSLVYREDCRECWDTLLQVPAV